MTDCKDVKLQVFVFGPGKAGLLTTLLNQQELTLENTDGNQ